MWLLTGVSEYLRALIYMQSMDISKLINISEPELKFILGISIVSRQNESELKRYAVLLTCW